MNVAVVLFGYRPNVGGSYTFQSTLVDTLRALEPETRHQFVYYSAGLERTTENEEVIRIPGGRIAKNSQRAIELARAVQDRWVGRRRLDPPTWLERSLDEKSVDLVWFASHYAEECNRPFIFNLWDLAHLEQPWFPEVSRNGEWERRHHHFMRFLPRATRVIVANEAGKSELLRGFPIGPDRLLVLHHPTPAFAVDAGARPQLPKDALRRHGIREPYLFYPAQFWAHKNHMAALQALAQLRVDGGDTYELVLVGGDQGELEHVRGLAGELGVSDAVHLLGFVDEDELVALYQHAHALIFPSFFGPENLPPLEAFALGCPVIAADVPGASEQLGDAAILVPPTDPEAFALGVRQLEDERLRSDLVDAGRRRAQEQSPHRYVSGVIDFLDEFERIRRCWR